MSANLDRLGDRLGSDDEQRGNALRDRLERQLPEIAKALPSSMPPERFTRIVWTECRANPDLALAAAENPASMLGAVMLLAQLGLEPGPLGHCYLTPRTERHGDTRRRVVVPIIGYRGLIRLARRSGELRSIEAWAVHEADHFRYERGLHEVLEHRPALNDRGPVVAYYMLARFRPDGHHWDVWSRAEVEAHRDAYVTGWDHPRSPWQTAPDDMARKTLIRQNAAFLPMDTVAAHAIAGDETVTTDLGPLADRASPQLDLDPARGEDRLDEVPGFAADPPRSANPDGGEEVPPAASSPPERDAPADDTADTADEVAGEGTPGPAPEDGSTSGRGPANHRRTYTRGELEAKTKAELQALHRSEGLTFATADRVVTLADRLEDHYAARIANEEPFPVDDNQEANDGD